MNFVATRARRERVPLLIGLCGPSSSGKTFSALRLASGIRRETGGDIYVIDTEARRSLHYADRFDFQHVEFGAPFGSLRYLEALQWAVKQGAKVIVLDSMSHEHEGPGGYLETHEKELTRLAGDDWKKRNSMNFLAWARPAAERRALINGMLQLECNFVFCFRAKEKLKIERGKDPVDLGWMPIAGPEFVFEMTLQALLLPGSGGVPTWRPEMPGERAMVKLPAHFRSMFEGAGRPLDEDTGAALAQWARGDGATRPAASSPEARNGGAGGPAPSPAPPAISFAGVALDPASPEALQIPIPLEEMESGDWRKFAAALGEAVKAAPVHLKSAWLERNAPELLRLKALHPNWVSALHDLVSPVAQSTTMAGESGASADRGLGSDAPPMAEART